MLKNICLAGASLCAMAGAAVAADLPSRTLAPVFVAPPIFTWTGFYAGFNAGYALGNDSKSTIIGNTAANAANVASGLRPSTAKVSGSGFTGGGQIGYNYQFGAGSGIVVGVEADIAYIDVQKQVTVVSNGPRLNTFRDGLDYLGTVRGRIGYSFGQILLYGTGGFAYGGLSDRANFYDTVGNLAFTGRTSSTRTGYAYGGGIEYALPTDSFFNFFKSSAVTIKAEYIRYDLGRTNQLLNPTPAFVGSYTRRVSTTGDLVRVGLNYKF